MQQSPRLLFLFTLLLLALAPFSCATDPASPISTTGTGECLAPRLACATGCVDPLTDAGNCGACGAACPGGTSCVNGACACPAGLSSCNGVCTDLTTSAANCGGCGMACQGTQTCAGGSCQCQAGYAACPEGCVDTLTSPTNCGACGTACQAGLVCSQGTCAATCAGGETNCNGACIPDLSTNRENCGSCGVACPSDQSCVAGVCSCAAGTQSCNGTCVDTTSDAQNCGACGMVCGGGQQCAGSACACPSGQEMCNGSCAAAGSCNSTTTTGFGGSAGSTSTMDSTSSTTMGGASSTTDSTSSTSMGGASNTSSTTSTTGNGGSSSGDCTITADVSTSSAIGTVGIVTWSTDLAGITSAEIHFSLDDGSGPERVAPVDLNEADYRTLLLGMKGSRSYNVQIFATAGGTTCSSDVYSVTTSNAPGNVNITQTTNNASQIAPGFIILCGGIGGGGNYVYIVDEDGDVVWAAASPQQTSRAHMDWEGKNMWMVSLNVQNGGGEMRRVSMDGLDTENNVNGLDKCHHDFTVVPGGIVACPSWTTNGMDPPSDIIERAPNGTITAVARDSELYSSNTYHSNSIHYHEADDSYTLGDRNPNLYVKFSRSTGQVQWQFGGNGSTFSGVSSWQVNHGHHLLDNGNFLFFNNGQGGNSSPVFEYSLSGNSATQVWTFNGGGSLVLGDIQRLANENTLITYSTNGTILEIDSSDNTVRQLKAGSFGYADQRPTLYGPPAR